MNVKLATSLALVFCLAFLPAAGLARSNHAEVLDGHVTVTRISDYDLLVTLDHRPDAAGDGIADVAFVYRSVKALPALPDVDGAARFIVRSESIAMKTEDGVVLMLSTRPADSEGPSVPFAKSGRAIVVDAGFQLTRLYAADGETLINFAYRMLRPVDRWSPFKAVVGGGDCTEGGPGHDNCSISGPIEGGGEGCSVTCGSGYACCNSSGCSCEGIAQ